MIRWRDWLQVVDALEDQLSGGGCVVDYHSCDFFPERCAQSVGFLRKAF
jgi:adenylate kinase